MIELAAISCLSIAPHDLRSVLRSLLPRPLRRAGTFAELYVAGICDCTDASELLATTVLCSSAYGARRETKVVLDELANNSEPMPFDFVATQPTVAAVHAAQQLVGINRASFLWAQPDDRNTWPRLLQLAMCWIIEGRSKRILCGWVEEAPPASQIAENRVHLSHWLALTGQGLTPAPLAHLRVADNSVSLDLPRDPCPAIGKGEEHFHDFGFGAVFVPALHQWLHGSSSIPAGFLDHNVVFTQRDKYHPESATEAVTDSFQIANIRFDLAISH